MLRSDNGQPSLWEFVLLPELFKTNEKLERVDRLAGLSRDKLKEVEAVLHFVLGME